MNTTLNTRIAAAVSAVAITFTLFSAVVSEAQPPVAGAVLAQATTTTLR